MTIDKAGTPTAVAAGTADVQGVAAATGLRFFGFSVRETAGATATAVLRHGTQATDPPIAFISLAANGVASQSFPPQGIYCPNGIFVDRVTGNTELSLWTGAGE